MPRFSPIDKIEANPLVAWESSWAKHEKMGKKNYYIELGGHVGGALGARNV
jgi:hypothetical protein